VNILTKLVLDSAESSVSCTRLQIYILLNLSQFHSNAA